MNHGGLFSGIGGFDLAAEWMGWQNIFHCENNEFSQKILKHHFPNSISYGDITKTDFSIHRGTIDVLTGGFPCQPFSVAGKRKGTEDERHLWPSMLRAIREVQPCWVVGENVRGLIDWSGGLVFDQVQVDLEDEGYEVLPFILPACAVNAPHRRDRIWFIAYSNCDRLYSDKVQKRKYNENNIWFNCIQFQQMAASSRKYIPNSRPNGTNNGLPNGLDECRLKAIGNSIVPGIAFEIFKAIEKYNELVK